MTKEDQDDLIDELKKVRHLLQYACLAVSLILCLFAHGFPKKGVVGEGIALPSDKARVFEAATQSSRQHSTRNARGCARVSYNNAFTHTTTANGASTFTGTSSSLRKITCA
jgi:hypothetical protein